MKVKVTQPIFAESASKLVNTASLYPETILLKKEHWVVDAKSLLGVIALSLQPEEVIDIELPNTDNANVLEALLHTSLFEKHE
jgi:phosphocarrier protein HPr